MNIVYPPGPRDRFLGAALYHNSQRDSLGFMENMVREHGDLVHFRIGRQHVYLLNHPDLIRDVLLTHYPNFLKGRGLLRRNEFLGEGLLTSEGDFHQRQRRQTQPAFHHDRVAPYGAIMSKLAADVSDSWQSGEQLSVLEAMRRITLSVISNTLFGSSVDVSHDEIIDAFRTGLSVFKSFRPAATRIVDRLLLLRRWRVRQAGIKFETLISQMIAERRRQQDDRGDLLSMLLSRNASENDQLITDRQIRDEAVTLFIGGFENIATALTWTWYLLAQNPQIQQRLYREVDTVLSGRLPTTEDLPHLTYTRMVFEESMRIYPPVPRLVRTALRDYKAGGYTIPAGAMVVVSQYLMHRDARYYSAPLRFDPERWTPAAKSSRPAYSYFPFGGGPRRCIGEGFAYMEGILLLATLASRWRFHLDSQAPVKTRVTHFLHPVNLAMTVKRRTTQFAELAFAASANQHSCQGTQSFR
jgi:cytochrome P450